MAYPADGSNDVLSLKAAESETYELGLKSANRFGDMTLAAFQTQTKNDIVSAGNDGGRSTFRNADETLRKGLELSWSKDLWRDLAAQASYSYIDATFDADIPAIGTVAAVSSGNYIPGIAKNQAFVRLCWKPENGFNAGLDVRYSARIFVNDINSEVAPSYTVAGANVGYNWTVKDLSIKTFARVDNLFDKDYSGSVIVNESNGRFYEPAEGRNWSA
ncbi:UNVERIFIED_CONTAM: TonB-dependent receptor, partial [Staphylococcus haemolyticus]